MIVVIKCPMCCKTYAIKVDYDEFCAWQNGELIQVAMPDLSPTQREQLISDLCPECQDKIFGGE